MSHRPTCQIMNPPNSQTTVRHMSITCCFMCSCAPTDHRLGRAHTVWSKINTNDQFNGHYLWGDVTINHSWQDNANTLPILKVYGGLCAHHKSFNPNKCWKALPYPTHAMSHRPTCQIMNPPNSQTTVRHMSITCCFMCSCAPTDHRLGRAHTFWSKINTYDQIQRLSFMRWCHKQKVLEWVGLE